MITNNRCRKIICTACRANDILPGYEYIKETIRTNHKNMTTYIALFRGINVGGHNKLPMKKLRAILETLGYENVATYIQSGNAVFTTGDDRSSIEAAIAGAIEKRFGFKPRVLILTQDEMQDAASANPFPGGEDDPGRLHLSFLTETPENPDLQKLEDLKSDTERFTLCGQVFYLHAPDGIGRSKLAGRLEKALGVPATSRNWRTVQKIMGIAKNIGT